MNGSNVPPGYAFASSPSNPTTPAARRSTYILPVTSPSSVPNRASSTPWTSNTVPNRTVSNPWNTTTPVQNGQQQQAVRTLPSNLPISPRRASNVNSNRTFLSNLSALAGNHQSVPVSADTVYQNMIKQWSGLSAESLDRTNVVNRQQHLQSTAAVVGQFRPQSPTRSSVATTFTADPSQQQNSVYALLQSLVHKQTPATSLAPQQPQLRPSTVNPMGVACYRPPAAVASQTTRLASPPLNIVNCQSMLNITVPGPVATSGSKPSPSDLARASSITTAAPSTTCQPRMPSHQLPPSTTVGQQLIDKNAPNQQRVAGGAIRPPQQPQHYRVFNVSNLEFDNFLTNQTPEQQQLVLQTLLHPNNLLASNSEAKPLRRDTLPMLTFFRWLITNVVPQNTSTYHLPPACRISKADKHLLTRLSLSLVSRNLIGIYSDSPFLRPVLLIRPCHVVPADWLEQANAATESPMVGGNHGDATNSNDAMVRQLRELADAKLDRMLVQESRAQQHPQPQQRKWQLHYHHGNNTVSTSTADRLGFRTDFMTYTMTIDLSKQVVDLLTIPSATASQSSRRPNFTLNPKWRLVLRLGWLYNDMFVHSPPTDQPTTSSHRPLLASLETLPRCLSIRVCNKPVPLSDPIFHGGQAQRLGKRLKLSIDITDKIPSRVFTSTNPRSRNIDVEIGWLHAPAEDIPQPILDLLHQAQLPPLINLFLSLPLVQLSIDRAYSVNDLRHPFDQARLRGNQSTTTSHDNELEIAKLDMAGLCGSSTPISTATSITLSDTTRPSPPGLYANCIPAHLALEREDVKRWIRTQLTSPDDDAELAIVDDDLQVTDFLPICLQCPLTQTRIQLPVRSVRCKHLQCFDFTTYMTINRRRPRWTCPNCGVPAPYRDLRLDLLFADILADFKSPDAKFVHVHLDGSWSCKELGLKSSSSQDCNNLDPEEPASTVTTSKSGDKQQEEQVKPASPSSSSQQEPVSFAETSPTKLDPSPVVSDCPTALSDKPAITSDPVVDEKENEGDIELIVLSDSDDNEEEDRGPVQPTTTAVNSDATGGAASSRRKQSNPTPLLSSASADAIETSHKDVELPAATLSSKSTMSHPNVDKSAVSTPQSTANNNDLEQPIEIDLTVDSDDDNYRPPVSKKPSVTKVNPVTAAANAFLAKALNNNGGGCSSSSTPSMPSSAHQQSPMTIVPTTTPSPSLRIVISPLSSGLVVSGGNKDSTNNNTRQLHRSTSSSSRDSDSNQSGCRRQRRTRRPPSSLRPNQSESLIRLTRQRRAKTTTGDKRQLADDSSGNQTVAGPSKRGRLEVPVHHEQSPTQSDIESSCFTSEGSSSSDEGSADSDAMLAEEEGEDEPEATFTSSSDQDSDSSDDRWTPTRESTSNVSRRSQRYQSGTSSRPTRLRWTRPSQM